MSEKETTSEDTKPEQTAPGDETSPGTESAGENFCPTCGGSGRREGRRCPDCGGTGRVVEAMGGG
jgi:DnaJ-class molecular chaperone